MPKPTLRQLSYLSALAECGHFRRAAERMGVSQPSLSVQLRLLEETLGTELVERGRGGAMLTPMGREIVERARKVLDGVQDLVDFAAGAQDGLGGTVRLGAGPTLGPYLLPHLVARLHREHRDLKLYVREGPPAALQTDLASGIHDVVLAQTPFASGDFVTEPLFREPLHLVVAADHPLAKRDTVSPNDLADLDVLAIGPEYRLHHQVARLCDDFGAILSRDYEATSLDALRQMVGMDMGVSFLPALYVRSEIPARSEVAVKRLSGRALHRTIVMAWRKSTGRADAYRHLADLIRDVVAKRFKDLTALA